MAFPLRAEPPVVPDDLAERWLKERVTMRGTVQIMVGPVLAAAMLKRNHPTPDDPTPNRPLRDGDVRKLADEMREGKWIENGQAIIFASNGRLNDGQHRLHAVILSGCTVPMDVRFGIERAAMKATDIGRKRAPSDWLNMLGLPQGQTVAAAARLLVSYQEIEEESVDFNFAAMLTPSMTEKVVMENPGLVDAALRSCMFYREFRQIPKSIWAFCYFVCEKIDRDDAERFFNALATGVGFESPNDPANVARKFFINPVRDISYRRPGQKIAVIFKAWNSFRLGRKRTLLRIRRDGEHRETFPHPL